MFMTMDLLSEKYKEYSNINEKIATEVKNGNLVKVAHGMYETDRNLDGKYLAGCIYGPSYLSFEYALSEYNLIPEGVRWFTSATFHKKKKKHYRNEFGNFSYRDVPDSAYPWGHFLKEVGEYSYQIATPEKALCDKLYTMSPVRSVKEIEAILFENLRIDEGDFWAMSMKDISRLASLFHSNNLYCLAKFVEKKSGIWMN
ncbi:MAG: hypothetical protein LUD47_02375 [Clostridia bacterium]|nr:hypothetical protein [Clostridia bacterium]